MDQRAKVGYPMDKKPRFKKNIHGSPLMLRESFMGLENFPKPSPEVKNLILEDVNRHHQDSSEDEA